MEADSAHWRGEGRKLITWRRTPAPVWTGNVAAPHVDGFHDQSRHARISTPEHDEVRVNQDAEHHGPPGLAAAVSWSMPVMLQTDSGYHEPQLGISHHLTVVHGISLSW
jgi:hypothetical protein